MTEALTFESWWREVLDYCDEVGIESSYCEDEFIIDGELEKVEVTFVDPITGQTFQVHLLIDLIPKPCYSKINQGD